MVIGERIKQKRQNFGLTQEELGMRLGYKKSAVCRLEKENVNIGTDRLFRIAKALKTSPEYLMGWDNGSIAAVGENTEEDVEFLSIYNSLNHDSRHILLEVARRMSGSTN